MFVTIIKDISTDLGGFLDYHISYGLQERPKNLVKQLMKFDFDGTDEEVWQIYNIDGRLE